MNNSKRLLPIARIFHRNLSQSASTSEAIATKIKTLKETQKNFQLDDGTPVYIKGGLGDKLIYHFTLGATAIGLGLCLDTFYRITFK